MKPHELQHPEQIFNNVFIEIHHPSLSSQLCSSFQSCFWLRLAISITLVQALRSLPPTTLFTQTYDTSQVIFPMKHQPMGSVLIPKGQSPYQVYGLALCRVSVSNEDCWGRVSNASQDILNRCPNTKGATIWYDKYMLIQVSK